MVTNEGRMAEHEPLDWQRIYRECLAAIAPDDTVALQYVGAIVTKAAAMDADEQGRPSGTMPCVICGAPLFYSVAKSNGHIRASCSTGQCVRFME